MIFKLDDSVNTVVKLPFESDVEVYIKREDAIHSFVSGNKYRKLKYNLKKAKDLGFETLLTFGGAYSNHIAAVAYSGKLFGFKTIGVIRGEEVVDKISSNSTLSFAKDCGMQFKFISREDYRQKTEDAFFNNLKNEYESFYLVPEGGTNTLAVKGCEEILTEADKKFDYVCCAVGTGGTMSGLINSSELNQKVLGFPALKGSFLHKDISKFASQNNWELITDYHFGGYAKVNKDLIDFINFFKEAQHIQLDPVYTGKMMYGIFSLIEKGYFSKGAKILAIHTGGLQGIEGMNVFLKKKGLPLIKYNK